jgi:hypothetical protein
VIPTLRRSRDDVFLIGEEQILEDQGAADPDLTLTTGLGGGHSSRRRSGSPRTPGSLHGARGLALAGLATGLPAILLALELGGGGGPAHRTRHASPPSPLISRSAARVPAVPATRVHPRAARSAEVHRHTVVHHPRPRRPDRPEPGPPRVAGGQPEREPTIQVAPVSSPSVVPEAPAPAAPEGPAPTGTPTPPGPPPSSSGGGRSGVESFGFER